MEAAYSHSKKTLQFSAQTTLVSGIFISLVSAETNSEAMKLDLSHGSNYGVWIQLLGFLQGGQFVHLPPEGTSKFSARNLLYQ